jgi:hypothetical protein
MKHDAKRKQSYSVLQISTTAVAVEQRMSEALWRSYEQVQPHLIEHRTTIKLLVLVCGVNKPAAAQSCEAHSVSCAAAAAVAAAVCHQ